jgi:hypothetical protein
MVLALLLVLFYFIFEKYSSHIAEQIETSDLILAPKVNDIYFLDFNLLSDKLERKNKYKLAKIIRVTDEGLSIVYGRFFYQWQYSVVNSIQYGDLSNSDYFLLLPDFIPFSEIKKMRGNGSIYLIKRPVRNKLYGNLISS